MKTVPVSVDFLDDCLLIIEAYKCSGQCTMIDKVIKLESTIIQMIEFDIGGGI